MELISADFEFELLVVTNDCRGRFVSKRQNYIFFKKPVVTSRSLVTCLINNLNYSQQKVPKSFKIKGFKKT